MKNIIISILFVIVLFVVNCNKLKTKGDIVVSPPENATLDLNEKYYIPLLYENYSGYKVPTRLPWGPDNKSIKTTWTRIRYDPKTLLVDTSDYTYSSSEGKVDHHAGFNTKVPYATAFGCESPNSADGEAKIDLRGTVFAVDDTFSFNGWLPGGSATVSNNGQVVLLKGGGYCGWIAPKLAANEQGAYTGGFHLKLKILPIPQYFDYDSAGNAWIKLPSGNTSNYKLPSRKPWGTSDSDLTTTWNKIRVDPNTLAIFTDDFTYSTSQGRVSHEDPKDKIAFGVARGCEYSYNADGKAYINLVGTPFKFTDNAESLFLKGGWQPAGSITIANNRQSATITGGGYCGWFAPGGNQKGGKIEGLIKLA